MSGLRLCAAVTVFLGLASAAIAEQLSFVPHMGIPPLVPSSGPGLGAPIVLPEAIVGSVFAPYGVDFSWGRQETTFLEAGYYVLAGIDDLGVCDLLSAIDAQIVVPETGQPGVTDYLDVQIYTYTNVKLEAFDVNGALLETVFSSTPDIIVSRPTADIAFFRVSEWQSYGFGFELTALSLIRPTPIPEPSSAVLAVVGLVALIATAAAPPRHCQRHD